MATVREPDLVWFGNGPSDGFAFSVRFDLVWIEFNQDRYGPLVLCLS